MPSCVPSMNASDSQSGTQCSARFEHQWYFWINWVSFQFAVKHSIWYTHSCSLTSLGTTALILPAMADALSTVFESKLHVSYSIGGSQVFLYHCCRRQEFPRAYNQLFHLTGQVMIHQAVWRSAIPPTIQPTVDRVVSNILQCTPFPTAPSSSPVHRLWLKWEIRDQRSRQSL